MNPESSQERWKQPEKPKRSTSSRKRDKSSSIFDLVSESEIITRLASSISENSRVIVWNPDVHEDSATENLDDQPPATIYYLGLIKDIPEVEEVFVESSGEYVKLWAVLERTDFEVMDRIYDIEESTLDRFPTMNLNFRVTVKEGEGEGLRQQATKIYHSQ